jgi:4-amino-4-deoxy-L-arabinose transferase-like glycosyltransferase
VLWTHFKHSSLLTAIAAFVLFTNLGGPRLWDRDEPRNAGAAREMLARQDFVVPWFNAELRTHKPVLLYWCIMAAYTGFGVNEFAARLPSALAAIGSVICVYLSGRRLFGAAAGLWAGIALATSLMFVVAGRAATPDSLLIFCTTLALAIYIRGTFRPRFDSTPLDSPPVLHSSSHAPREESITRSVMPTMYFPQHWPTVLAMYGVMGLGVLAKGPVGLILPTAVIGLFLLIVRLPARGEDNRPWTLWRVISIAAAPFEPLHFLKTCWTMRPFTAIFAAAAVALPWYWAVGLATDGEFLRGFFLEHNLSRATAPMEHHGGNIFYYPIAMLIGFFPWSIFALPLALDTALHLRRQVVGTLRVPWLDGTRSVPTTYDSIHPGYLLCACWIAVYVVLFSIARTKLPSYVTPCYPALAMLAGNYIDRFSRHSAAVAGRWLVAAFACLALVGVAIAAGIPVLAKQQLPGEEWLGLIGLIPLTGGVACIGLAVVRSYRAAAGVLALTAVSFAALLFAVATDRIDRHQHNHVLLKAIYARSGQPRLAAYKVLEPTWIFYGGQPIHEFTAGPAHVSSHPAQEAATFLATDSNAFLITTEQKAAELTSLLPPEIEILERVPYFLKRNQNLVLLGHRSPQDATAGLSGSSSSAVPWPGEPTIPAEAPIWAPGTSPNDLRQAAAHQNPLR